MKNVRWMSIVAAVVLAAVIGGIAYNAGVAQGIEESGKVIAAPGGPYPYPYMGWHRPWGFGFLFGPLFFILFWIVIARGLFGRGGWSRRCGGGLDEWHRRAHERVWNDPTGSGTSGGTSAEGRG
jgi:hypothetical protein